LHGGGVDADLVAAGAEQLAGVVGAADPAADGQGDEDLLRGGAHDVVDRVALLVGGGDVEEDELVGALGVVDAGELHRVPGVAEVDELHALDDAAGGDVEAGD